MIDESTIHDLQLKATLKASRHNARPFVVWEGDKEKLLAGTNLGYRTIPFLGNYIPLGWKREETLLFVGSSGFGDEGGLALTFPRFVEKMEVGKGYAVVEMGEFQVYVGVYTKEAVN